MNNEYNLENKKMFYFTFTLNQAYKNYFQCVLASNEMKAREKMFEVWSDKWGFCYTAEEWEKTTAKLQSLPVILQGE